MNILFDTSVLVASLIEAHPSHLKSFAWLKRVISGGDKGFISAHSLAETYTVLTTLPVQPRISPIEARELIQKNIISNFEIVNLLTEDYIQVLNMLAELGIVGGATYDALLLRAASKSKVDVVVTLNEKDFKRVYPELANKIVSP